MNFDLTDEQAMLRDMVGRYLRERYDFETRRLRLREGDGQDLQLWAMLAELGVLGAAVQERDGGLGGGAVETMLIMEALGEALVTEPYLETIVIGAALLASFRTPAAAAVLSRVSGGEVRIAAALDPSAVTTARSALHWHLTGLARTVIHAPGVSHIIVAAQDATGRELLFLLDAGAPGLVLHPYRLIDDRPAADITLDATVPPEALLGSGDVVQANLEATIDAARAALCAEAVGVLRRMLADTVAYAKQRMQFGQPLARFQVLQHRMVDMFIALEQTVSAAYLATLTLDAPPADRAKAVAAAKAMVGLSARFIGEQAVQLHGSMGMTEELAVGHYFKRATAIAHHLGTSDEHLLRYSAMQRALFTAPTPNPA